MLELIVPPADYAEDQEYGRLVLGVHVLHRGFNMGAIIGIASSLAVSTVRRVRKPGYQYAFGHTLRFAARGGLYGLGLGGLALAGRMYSRDLIEWQDRSWRLLRHPTQNQTDDWSLAGASAGMVAAAAMYRAAMPRALVGGAALGSSAAIVAMLAVRSIRGSKV